MRKIKWTVALAMLATAMLCAASHAATITFNIQYSQSYDSAGNPTARSLNAQSAPHAGSPVEGVLPTDFHEFAVFMTVAGLGAGEDFQTAVFDMELGPGVTPNLTFGGAYFGENPLYDPPPNGPGVGANTSVLSQNGDAGAPNDLKAITVIANSNPSGAHQGTHLRHPGEAGEVPDIDPENAPLGANMLLGLAYVNWADPQNVGGKSWLGVSDPQGLINTWSSVLGAVATSYGAADMTQGPRSEWVVIPEPASITLLGLALIGGLGFIRRR